MVEALEPTREMLFELQSDAGKEVWGQVSTLQGCKRPQLRGQRGVQLAATAHACAAAAEAAPLHGCMHVSQVGSSCTATTSAPWCQRQPHTLA